MKEFNRPIATLATCSIALVLAALAFPHAARADEEKKDKKDHKHKAKHEEQGGNGFSLQRQVAEALSPHAVVRAVQDSGQVRVRQERSGDYGRSYNNERGSGYNSGSHSNFSIVLGDGYRGRGYYYGPPGLSYYNDAPGVSYYSNERSIPREYRSTYSAYGRTSGQDVQEALSQRGYYRGAIDGDIGPGSRRAISNFQADYGLRVTGRITPELISTLGL